MCKSIAWGLDDADEIFHLLSLSLRQELLNFEEPQADTMSPRYDTLVKLLCEYSYSGYSNENLGNCSIVYLLIFWFFRNLYFLKFPIYHVANNFFSPVSTSYDLDYYTSLPPQFHHLPIHNLNKYRILLA